MTPEEIGRLAEAARRAGIRELELHGPDTALRLRIARTPTQDAIPDRAPEEAVARRGVRSPGVGLFHHRHPLTGRPLSEAGQPVAPGHIVGFLDGGSSLRPVMAPAGGIIGAPIPDDGTLVGFGTLLYPLE